MDLSVDDTGPHGIDPDTFGRDLAPEADSEDVNGALACRIFDAKGRCTEDRRCRREIDDGTALPAMFRRHAFHRLARTEERAHDVDVEQPLQPFEAHLVEPRLAVHDAGIVDQHLERAQLVGLREQAQHIRLARHIAADRDRLAALGRDRCHHLVRRPDWSAWLGDLQASVAAAANRDAALLTAEADPIHPARIYGELVPRLADDAVVIGDGGDFVSFAGKFIEPQRPGGWLDPGPYGCLGAGLGAAIAARLARPSAQVVLLMGDGAAGFSLMDVDTLVRHRLPVVIVVGNNSAWGLEKGPMQMLYGYDVAADLAPQTGYDAVVRALGGGGETVTDPAQIGPALDRAFASGVPYLVNVITDVDAAYPRNTFGI